MTNSLKQGKLSAYLPGSQINMHTKPLKNGYLISSDAYESEASEDWFSPEYWQTQDAIVNSKEGRTTAWFYRYNDSIFVLKHYRRGGLVGKILSDQYLYSGLKNTRIYQEFTLLEELQNKGLSAPVPKAAQVRVSGMVYRGDLITEAIAGAQSLCEVCQSRVLHESEIIVIGQTLAAFHNAGVYHADLNINNILFDDQGKAFLIDFDRGEFRKPDKQWQQSNISRLKRSFDKESQKWPQFYFSEDDWLALVNSYQEALNTGV